MFKNDKWLPPTEHTNSCVAAKQHDGHVVGLFAIWTLQPRNICPKPPGPGEKGLLTSKRLPKPKQDFLMPQAPSNYRRRKSSKYQSIQRLHHVPHLVAVVVALRVFAGGFTWHPHVRNGSTSLDHFVEVPNASEGLSPCNLLSQYGSPLCQA